MKKYLCLLLASLMLLSLVSCGKTTEEGKETGTSGNQPDQTEAETADPHFTCELPDHLHYKDEKVHILYADVVGRDDELVSTRDGGVVSTAVHERNVTVEEMLHVKLDYIPTKTDVNTLLDKDIKGGNCEFDVITNATHLAITPAMKGLYLDLNSLEYIDTDKYYWTQGYNDMVTFTDRNMQFLASGSLAISMQRLMYLTIYNKTLLEANQIPDLYETVKEGKWTLDYQFQISTDRYIDTDGDSKRSEGDSYGFITGNCVSVDPYPVSAGVHMVIKEPETGNLTYNTKATASLSDLCSKVQQLYNDPSTYVYQTDQHDNVGKNDIIQKFADNSSLMATTMFLAMEHNFNDLSSLSYGIAPMPKFDEEQAEYHSYVQDQVSSFGVSTAVKDENRQNMCAATLEAMCYHSHQLVRPAYYETVLSSRFMQDPQSKEILDMLFHTLYFDFSSTCSGCFSGCVIRDNLRPLLSGKRNTIASSTKKWDKIVNITLKKYNANFDKLYG